MPTGEVSCLSEPLNRVSGIHAARAMYTLKQGNRSVLQIYSIDGLTNSAVADN